MSRILLGNRNGIMGAWISAPGEDASDDGAKMLLSSSNDQLIVHHYETKVVDGDGGGDGWGYFNATITFSSLSYIPLYMFDIGRNTIWPPNQTDNADILATSITTSSLTVDWRHPGYSGDERITAFIFRNPRPGAL